MHFIYSYLMNNARYRSCKRLTLSSQVEIMDITKNNGKQSVGGQKHMGFVIGNAWEKYS